MQQRQGMARRLAFAQCRVRPTTEASQCGLHAGVGKRSPNGLSLSVGSAGKLSCFKGLQNVNYPD